MIPSEVKEYFGKVYKGRDLPQGVYKIKGKKYLAVIYDKKTGRSLKAKNCDTPVEAVKNLKDFRDGHHWYGIKHDPENNFGFIYRVTELSTGRMYIGRKQYRFWDGPRGGYKCTDLNDKEWFREDLWKESDWRYYKTSAPMLAKAIENNPDDYLLETVSLHPDKLSLMLAEVALQMDEDVLNAELSDGSYKYFNANVASCLFKAPVSKTEMKALREEAMKFVSRDIEKYIVRPTVCECGATVPYGEEPCH